MFRHSPGECQTAASPPPPLLRFELGPTPLTPVARRLAGLPVDGFSTRSTRRRRSRPSSSWADAGAARTDAGGRLFDVPFACGPGPLYARKWPAAGGIVAVSRAFCVLRCVVCPFMNPSEGADVVKIVCSGVSNLPISDPIVRFVFVCDIAPYIHRQNCLSQTVPTVCGTYDFA